MYRHRKIKQNKKQQYLKEHRWWITRLSRYISIEDKHWKKLTKENPNLNKFNYTGGWVDILYRV